MKLMLKLLLLEKGAIEKLILNEIIRKIKYQTREKLISIRLVPINF